MKDAYSKYMPMPPAAAKTLPFILFALAMLALAGCAGAGAAATGGAAVGLGTEGALFVAGKPAEPPPADYVNSIKPHESWCYETMGDPVCYAHPQDVEPDRLINVDPPNRYPLTPRAYGDALKPPPPPAAVPVAAPDTAPLPVAPVPVTTQ